MGPLRNAPGILTSILYTVDMDEAADRDLAGILTDEEAEKMREAIEEQEERTRERLDQLTGRLDS